MLKQAIRDYLRWMRSMERRGSEKLIRHGLVLVDFMDFVREKNMEWQGMFTFDTLMAFRIHTNHKNPSDAVKGLALYLFRNGRIPQPLQVFCYQIDLPEVYEQYLIYHEKRHKVSYMKIRHIRRVLTSFYESLERLHVALCDLKLDHIEAFMAEPYERLDPATCKTYRFYLHDFLQYLYHVRKILPIDLAPLVVRTHLFDKSRSVTFLKPQELQKLFKNLKLTTPTHIRTYAMVHLAYYMGLRPGEISRIKIDDIDFKKKALTLQNRMADTITIRPMPEKTLKAVAAYLLQRPRKSTHHDHRYDNRCEEL
jgi:integrase